MPSEPICPVASTLKLIGGKWKPTILLHLKDEPRRFNELRRLIPGITQRVLTLQLRQLEQDGIIQRSSRGGFPLYVDYAFTSNGRTLGSILDSMEAWWRQRSLTDQLKT